MNSLNWKNRLCKLVMVLIIALMLEVFYFNFDYIFSRVDKSKKYNVRYTLDEVVKINWTEDGNKWISMLDPQLIIENINMYVDEIELIYSVKGKLDIITVFYSNDEFPIVNGDLVVVKTDIDTDKTKIEIKDNVEVLRIDLNENEGLSLEKIEILINPVQFQISISRIVAMLLIYLSAKGLFILQRPFNYELRREYGQG